MSSKGKVLVVDDERRNVTLLATRLRALGYEVIEAADGETALELARATCLDAVLSDVKMPGVDGFELTRRIKSDPRLSSVPVVLIMAFDDVEHRARGLDAGADDFLGKPVDPVELELRMRSQVRLHQLQQELQGRAELLGGRSTPAVSEGPGRIAVVEADTRREADARWQSAIGRKLAADGHAVTVATSLESGLAMLASTDPDVLILDLPLRDGSGVEILRRFRDGRRRDHQPMVLVLSSVDDPEDRLKMLRSGADDYVVKPVALEELEARVQAQLRRSRVSRGLRDQVDRARLEAARDALTGLFNRRFLDDDLARRVKRAASGHNGFSVAMLDVDYFKRINDAHGHGFGDQVLRALADRVAASVRESDLVCRYGGEELCLVLPATRLADGMQCLERVRADVARLSRHPLQPGEITVSAGVAEWMADESPDSVLRRADNAMYEAKKAGRNRVMAARTPSEAPATTVYGQGIDF